MPAMPSAYLWWQPRASPGFDGWLQLVGLVETEDQAIDSEKSRLRTIGRGKQRRLQESGVHVDALKLGFECGIVFCPPDEGEERVWAIDHFKERMLEFVENDAELATRLLQHQRAVHGMEAPKGSRLGEADAVWDAAAAYLDHDPFLAAGSPPGADGDESDQWDASPLGGTGEALVAGGGSSSASTSRASSTSPAGATPVALIAEPATHATRSTPAPYAMPTPTAPSHATTPSHAMAAAHPQGSSSSAALREAPHVADAAPSDTDAVHDAACRLQRGWRLFGDARNSTCHVAPRGVSREVESHFGDARSTARSTARSAPSAAATEASRGGAAAAAVMDATSADDAGRVDVTAVDVGGAMRLLSPINAPAIPPPPSASSSSASASSSEAPANPQEALAQVATRCRKLEDRGLWREASELLADAMLACKAHHDVLIRTDAASALQAHARRRAAWRRACCVRAAVRVQAATRGRGARRHARMRCTPPVHLGACLPSAPGGEVIIRLFVEEMATDEGWWGGDTHAAAGVFLLPEADGDVASGPASAEAVPLSIAAASFGAGNGPEAMAHVAERAASPLPPEPLGPDTALIFYETAEAAALSPSGAHPLPPHLPPAYATSPLPISPISVGAATSPSIPTAPASPPTTSVGNAAAAAMGMAAAGAAAVAAAAVRPQQVGSLGTRVMPPGASPANAHHQHHVILGGEKQRRAASSIQRALRLRRQLLTPPFSGSSAARIMEPRAGGTAQVSRAAPPSGGDGASGGGGMRSPSPSAPPPPPQQAVGGAANDAGTNGGGGHSPPLQYSAPQEGGDSLRGVTSGTASSGAPSPEPPSAPSSPVLPSSLAAKSAAAPSCVLASSSAAGAVGAAGAMGSVGAVGAAGAVGTASQGVDASSAQPSMSTNLYAGSSQPDSRRTSVGSTSSGAGGGIPSLHLSVPSGSLSSLSGDSTDGAGGGSGGAAGVAELLDLTVLTRRAARSGGALTASVSPHERKSAPRLSAPSARSWLRVSSLVSFKSTSTAAAPLVVRLSYSGASWSVAHPYKAFLAIDAQVGATRASPPAPVRLGRVGLARPTQIPSSQPRSTCACMLLTHTCMLAVLISLQLRGLAEPAADPPLASLPELGSARGGGDAKHAARLHALQAWLHAVCAAVQAGSLSSHAPLARLLELHTPLLVWLQAHARGHIARRRHAHRPPRAPSVLATRDERV